MTNATRVSTVLVAVLSLGVLGSCSADGPTADSSDDAAAVTTDAAPTATDAAPADTTAAPVAPNGEVVDVIAIDNTFRPETVEVSAGTEVRWTNSGRNEHNVLPIEGADWGVQTEDFAPQDVYSHVFTTPGTYAYYCSIHGTTEVGMVGTVVVTD